MLTKPTLFVIGAGAGVDVDMPVGDTLSSAIAKKLNISFTRQGRVGGDDDIEEALRRVAQENTYKMSELGEAARSVAVGIGYTRSIDGYLHTHKDNEKIKICAKLAIAQLILASERRSALFIDHNTGKRTFRDEAKVGSSWLADFMFLLQDKIVLGDSFNDFFKNMAIINFNYDRCLEHFLLQALMRLYIKKESDVTGLLNKATIIHPYGTVGKLPWQAADGVPFGGAEHFNDFSLLAKGIRTFNEQVEAEDVVTAIQKEVGKAARIVFLGFHFHKQNMELMRCTPGLPTHTAQIYATAYQRSESDLQVIRKDIIEMLNNTLSGGNLQNINRAADCKGLFREYGATLLH